MVRGATKATALVAAQPPPGYSEAVAAAKHSAAMRAASAAPGAPKPKITASASGSGTVELNAKPPLGGMRAPTAMRNVPFPCAADVAAMVAAAEARVRMNPSLSARIRPPLLASGQVNVHHHDFHLVTKFLKP